jgi:hypothetical protein
MNERDETYCPQSVDAAVYTRKEFKRDMRERGLRNEGSGLSAEEQLLSWREEMR